MDGEIDHHGCDDWAGISRFADLWKGRVKGDGDGFDVQVIERLSRLLEYALA